MAFWEDWPHNCCEWWWQWLWLLQEWQERRAERLRQRRRWRRRRGLSNEDIEFLKMELRSIHAALRLVGAVPSEKLPLHLKRWAELSREVSYDIQDILDTLLVRVEEAHPGSCKVLVSKMARPFLRYHRTRREIAEAIIDVKISVHEIGQQRAWYAGDGFIGADAIRVQEIPERRSRYQADTIAASANPGATSADTGLLDLIEDETPANNEAMKDIIRLLSMDTHDESNFQLKTVSIVGFGGLGKTTLAKAVYQKLQPQFHCSAFVSLSMNPNMGEVLSSMLEQLDNGKDTSEGTGEWDEGQLASRLRQILQNRRYLIAVDDIWDLESWEPIRHLMVENNLGSRIITTTRRAQVAIELGGVYELKSLSDDDSKSLFFKKLFGSEVTYHKDNQLDGVLDEILKICGGLPLALVTIAGFLARTPREEWYKVVNNITAGIEGGSNLETIREVVLQSYYGLPTHLRLCFLYVSMFPEDYEIRRDRLVWRWIAEEIQGKQLCSLFEIGQQYFEELCSRSFILPVDEDDVRDGMTKYCRVHDLILDISCSLASDENFVTKMVDEDLPWAWHFPGKAIRRLSLQKGQLGRRLYEPIQHVRSVAAFGSGINLMPPLSSFNILRVLDLEGCDLRGSCYNPEHLGKLFHLRYLGLRGTDVSRLPKGIGNLRFLQVLDLKGTRIRELPSKAALLHRLLCLHVEPDTRIPKAVMGNLTSLEELSKISVTECPGLVKELASLVELRVLDIVSKQGMGESLEEDLLESLCNLQKLQTLGIYGHQSKLDFMTTEGWAPSTGLRKFVAVDSWFSVLPTWISDAERLSELQIGVRELWRDGLQTLGRLPKLRFLCLAVERMGERLAVDADAFPNLTRLRISAETCLVFRRGAMPKLQVLEFVLDVDKADGEFNWGLSSLGSLEKVAVELRAGSSSASAIQEAEAALKAAVDSHPNRRRIHLEITKVTSQNKQIGSVDDRAGNAASSSEIQEERYAL